MIRQTTQAFGSGVPTTVRARATIRAALVATLAATIVGQATAQDPATEPTRAELMEEMREMRERMDTMELQLRGVDGAEEPASTDEATPPAEAPAEMPVTAGYDPTKLNGFFVRSPDDAFRLNVGAYTQIRYGMNWRGSEPGRAGEDFTRNASINRTRLFLEGQYTEALNYHFRINIDDTGDADLIVAYGQWNFAPDWSVRVGEQFMALSREDWMFAQDVLGVEFSANDFTFAIGSSIGAQVHHVDGNHRWWAGFSNGAFGGKETFGSLDAADIAFTGRSEWQLEGEDWSVWDDLVGRRGRADGWLFGVAGGYQLRLKDSPKPDHGAEVIADLSVNGDGYQAMIAGTWAAIDPDGGDWYNNYGVLLQGGYFVADRTQLYTAFEWIDPGDQPGDLDPFTTVSVGVNFFPFVRTNRWKFTAEVAYLFGRLDQTIVAPSDSLGWLASDESGQLNIRLQAQLGF